MGLADDIINKKKTTTGGGLADAIVGGRYDEYKKEKVVQTRKALFEPFKQNIAQGSTLARRAEKSKQEKADRYKKLATQKPDKDTEDVWAKKFAGFREEGATL